LIQFISRVDVGGRDIAVFADERTEFCRERAGDAFEFGLAVFRGVDDDTAFPTAVGDVDDGTLVDHPPGERLHFVTGDVRVIADTALVGAAVTVEL
jgi:hypothetical protein